MKKMMVLALLVSLVLFVPRGFAAGTATITVSKALQTKTLSIAIVGGTSGAFTDVVVDANTYGLQGWYLHSAEIVPGSPAPSMSYCVTLNDASGFDILQGNMMGQNSTTGVGYNFGPRFPLVRGNLTLSASGLGVTNAATTLILNFVTGKP